MPTRDFSTASHNHLLNKLKIIRGRSPRRHQGVGRGGLSKLLLPDCHLTTLLSKHYVAATKLSTASELDATQESLPMSSVVLLPKSPVSTTINFLPLASKAPAKQSLFNDSFVRTSRLCNPTPRALPQRLAHPAVTLASGKTPGSMALTDEKRNFFLKHIAPLLVVPCVSNTAALTATSGIIAHDLYYEFVRPMLPKWFQNNKGGQAISSHIAFSGVAGAAALQVHLYQPALSAEFLGFVGVFATSASVLGVKYIANAYRHNGLEFLDLQEEFADEINQIMQPVIQAQIDKKRVEAQQIGGPDYIPEEAPAKLPVQPNDRFSLNDFRQAAGILAGAASTAAVMMGLHLLHATKGTTEANALTLVATLARLGFSGWTALLFCAYKIDKYTIPYDAHFDAMTRVEFDTAHPKRGVEIGPLLRWYMFLPGNIFSSLCLSELIHQYLPNRF